MAEQSKFPAQWWLDMDYDQQKSYVASHPNSKYAELHRENSKKPAVTFQEVPVVDVVESKDQEISELADTIKPEQKLALEKYNEAVKANQKEAAKIVTSEVFNAMKGYIVGVLIPQVFTAAKIFGPNIKYMTPATGVAVGINVLTIAFLTRSIIKTKNANDKRYKKLQRKQARDVEKVNKALSANETTKSLIKNLALDFQDWLNTTDTTKLLNDKGVLNMKTQSQSKQQSLSASQLQEAYRSFFRTMLEKAGVKSPSQLEKEEKSSFFSNIKSQWAKVKAKIQGGQKLEVAMASVSSSFDAWESMSAKRKLSYLQKEYAKFFKAKLKGFGKDINSPAHLGPEGKTAFFNAIKAEWPKVKKGLIKDAKAKGIQVGPKPKAKVAKKAPAKRKAAAPKKATGTKRKAHASAEQSALLKQLALASSMLEDNGYVEEAQTISEIAESI